MCFLAGSATRAHVADHELERHDDMRRTLPAGADSAQHPNQCGAGSARFANARLNHAQKRSRRVTDRLLSVMAVCRVISLVSTYVGYIATVTGSVRACRIPAPTEKTRGE